MSFESNDEGSPFSSTALPPPPRVPSFVPRTVRAGRRSSSLALVAVNPNPMQTSATIPAIPALRLLPQVEPPTMPPPSGPTGSTPIRRAA